MMWNVLVGGLLTDAAIVLYDGSPAVPSLDRLWELAEATRITCFGMSAAFLSSCLKAGLRPRDTHDLPSLRSIGSTGSPLSPEAFRWVYNDVKPDLWLFSTSGGTDVCTSFVGGVPTLPVYEGELQARTLGARVEAFDEHGRSVVDQVGELVLTAPLPSMPVFFWGDTDGSKYRETYFGEYLGVWKHGDWIELTSRGTAIIYGRSDATINRGGVRIGTSEIYRALLLLAEVADALVVDLTLRGGDDWMPLFVVPADGVSLDPELVERIKRQIREQCSPRHVPDAVLAIDEVPRTLSGKVIEIPIKRILSGVPVEQAVSREGLANPAALDYFVRLAGELAQ